ncbi:MAG TPA: DAK2 domain-containing protein [Bacilli bacterium]
MSKRFINGTDFSTMVAAGAEFLAARVQNVNALNVFPVPDGDTGTNMNLTLSSGAESLRKKPSAHLGEAAETFAKGLLMGARGNSGVILSQLFRGFAKGVAGLSQADPQAFATALQQGVETAYKAVIKPVEGTILTVSREAAKHGMAVSRRADNILDLLNEVHGQAQRALARTPEQLPVLKQVGVVDAGGQGLVFIYAGFIQALRQDGGSPAPVIAEPPQGNAQAHLPAEKKRSAQSQLATEEIEFGYCTEFIVKLGTRMLQDHAFSEDEFRRQMGRLGDSLLVVADGELVKVHIHTEAPGDVMNAAMKYGALTKIKIENMREQHTHILEQDEYSEDGSLIPATNNPVDAAEIAEEKAYGFVAIAAGSGISDIFTSIGVDYVLSGGQTMNPSTADIVEAVNRVRANTVFVLPNNSNIILAAEQAKELAQRNIEVIRTKTMQQGMAALLAFQENADLSANLDAMRRAVQQIRSGQVTFAVRDSQFADITIKEGNYLAMAENQIVAASPDLLAVCMELMQKMIVNGDEMVTVFTGADADEDVTNRMLARIKEQFPEVELEVHFGGQPLYFYLFSVE